MVRLSDFIGELIKDIAIARTNADYSAVSASEQYHADPFIKHLPIPHYIIEEAEIEVPVIILGLKTKNEDYNSKKVLLYKVIKEQLPKILEKNFKWTYLNNKIKEENISNKEEVFDYYTYVFDDKTLNLYSNCIERIVEVVHQRFVDSIELYNYEVLKLLEITETFAKELTHAYKYSLNIMKLENINPYINDETINNGVKYATNIMFFNFKNIMAMDTGVEVDINTSRMNEYNQRDCLMHIKLKIKEQDLNLVVEDNQGKEKRYLSLT